LVLLDAFRGLRGLRGTGSRFLVSWGLHHPHHTSCFSTPSLFDSAPLVSPGLLAAITCAAAIISRSNNAATWPLEERDFDIDALLTLYHHLPRPASTPSQQGVHVHDQVINPVPAFGWRLIGAAACHACIMQFALLLQDMQRYDSVSWHSKRCRSPSDGALVHAVSANYIHA
jgi:hypothetical protein